MNEKQKAFSFIYIIYAYKYYYNIPDVNLKNIIKNLVVTANTT
jgi:hypothetical protein